MKKEKLLLGAATVASLALLCGCEKKEEVKTDDPTTPILNAINPDEFIGSWSSLRPYIDVTKEGDNEYKFLVNWGSSAWETEQWEYTCEYDANDQEMKCTGTRSTITFTDDGESSKSEVKAKKIKAEFKINEGKMTWNDEEQHGADDLVFEKKETN